MTFSEWLDEKSQPAAGTFTVGVSSGTAPTVSSYVQRRDRAVLTLSAAPTSAQSPTLSYAPGSDANPFKDRAGNALPSFSSESVTVGDILPNPVSLHADGTSLTVTFNTPLDTSSTPDASAFTVGVSSGTAPSVSSVSIAGNTVTLTLGAAVAAEQRLTLQYTKPGGDDDDVLQDDDGNEVASFKLRVQNVTSDLTAPTVQSASASGATLTVVFSEAMDADSIPAAGAFAVDVSGTTDDPAVTSITLYEDTATLTLSAVIKAGKTAKLTYTKPTGANAKPLRDLAGNDLASIPSATAKTVVNGTFETIVLNKTSLEVAEGGTGTFDVELSAQPPKDVTVRLSLDTDGVAELDTREPDLHDQRLGYRANCDGDRRVRRERRGRCGERRAVLRAERRDRAAPPRRAHIGIERDGHVGPQRARIHARRADDHGRVERNAVGAANRAAGRGRACHYNQTGKRGWPVGESGDAGVHLRQLRHRTVVHAARGRGRRRRRRGFRDHAGGDRRGLRLSNRHHHGSHDRHGRGEGAGGGAEDAADRGRGRLGHRDFEAVRRADGRRDGKRRAGHDTRAPVDGQPALADVHHFGLRQPADAHVLIRRGRQHGRREHRGDANRLGRRLRQQESAP